MKLWKNLPALCAVVFLGLCASASASSTFFVYNSFGPGTTYNNSLSWAVEGPTASHTYRGQAEFFVPATSGYLNAIQLAFHYFGGTGLTEINVAVDSGGIPGNILESFVDVPSAGIVTLGSASQPLLQAGVKYWLTVEPNVDDVNDNLGWFANSQGVAPGFAFDRSPWAWQAYNAPPNIGNPASGVFSVSVTAVPEPSTVALAVVLGSCLFARRLRLSRP